MKRGWFGPKRIGIGANPRTWEGWVVTLVFVAGIVASVILIGPWLYEKTGWPRPAVNFGIALVWIAGLIGVIALTYQSDDKS